LIGVHTRKMQALQAAAPIRRSEIVRAKDNMSAVTLRDRADR
jgi:hypothetical protein